MGFVLKINNLTIKYQSNFGDSFAVKNVSFTVESGDYCCIVGMNGSGKSSLIKGILGLIPVSSGSVEYGVKRCKISYMPQINSIPLNFPATVREIVLTGAQKQVEMFRLPFYSKEDKTAADNAMGILKIEGLAKKRFGELSGGQQQKVLLARALCRNPLLLVLDEPCAGLDEGATDSFYGLLYNLNNQSSPDGKVAVLMISHDLRDVQKYAKHIVEMDTDMLFYGTAPEWAEWLAKESGRNRNG
ncbi:MAG: ATP-binding cassette domain-containing protein [Oscillospiraceae bacterium]|nr:ATP-binding cassette domain-containing protein [Oscillospiraceae bacterium]